MTGKLIIFSAPSGSGKSTIINYLLTQNLNLAFSISATSRPPRGTEQHGVEYFFLTPEEFRQRIENNEFLEYEEVYKDRYYGTLKAQVEKQLEAGQNVVFDVDVVGGCNIKKFYGDRALSVFIQPPSVEELRCRLEGMVSLWTNFYALIRAVLSIQVWCGRLLSLFMEWEQRMRERISLKEQIHTDSG